jgi:CIC family chloride channel protein
MGWFVPQVMGVGYKYVGDALNGAMALQMMAILLVLKLVATAVSYSSGNAGGIFGPSLFMGAMLGGMVGGGAQHFFPGHVAQPGAYALVGMGAVFAGVIRAPMTSVVMIFEITRDYAVIVPLMIANLVSYFIASKIQKKPIYDILAEQDGIHLPHAESHERKTRRQVARVMRAATEVLKAEETVEAAVERVKKSVQRTWPVVDRAGLVGLLDREKLEMAMHENQSRVMISDLVQSGAFPHVHADQTCDVALERMGAGRLDVLPVVSRANVREVLGLVYLQDVLESCGLQGKDG